MEVVADSGRAERELPCNLAVGGARGSEPDDLEFLGRELAERICARAPRGDRACRPQSLSVRSAHTMASEGSKRLERPQRRESSNVVRPAIAASAIARIGRPFEDVREP